jgi:MFS transporter, ACS family, tartrate transporter
MTPDMAARTLDRIGLRLVPFLALLYFAAFLDRANVGFAAEGMQRDLGLSAYVYGLGAGIFFIGYVLFEVPSNLLLHRFGARRWIARIAITWALVALAMAFVRGPGSFCTVRFLLGMAEAGLFPGVVYYLTLWVPAARRARLVGWFMTAIPVSTALGGPVSGAILRLDGALGLAGWQWLFLLETIPSLILGVAALFVLPDSPAQARWLSPEEKHWLAQTLATEAEHHPVRGEAGLAGALADRRILALCLAYFGVEMALYGVILWLPQILRAAGIPAALLGMAIAVPYGLAAIGMVGWCRRSDRRDERAGHILAASVLGFVGLAASAFLGAAPLVSVAAVTLGAVGTLAILPIFWTLPAGRLHGAAAAGGIALINAVGNIGGFAGPFVIGWIKDGTGSFTYGLLAVATGVLLTGIVTWGLGRTRAV